ncbi:MAG: hypothetical protein AB1430_21380 [Pseudomonadota bacterium]
MADERPAAAPSTPSPGAKPASPAGGLPEDLYGGLRRLAGVGYQLRAAVRAGDRFLALDATDDHNTGVWLISCALALAEDVKTELDGLARSWKPRPTEAAIASALHRLRTRAHQLHAAARAADHFLDQDSSEDRSTGSWLVACALGLAEKLAGETEDLASAMKRATGDGAATDAGAARRPAPAVASTLRGVTVQ